MPAPSRQRWRSAASPISCTKRAFSNPLATSTAGLRTCRPQLPTTSATARASSRPRCAISAARWGRSTRSRANSRLTCGRRTSAEPAQEPAIFGVDRLVALADVPFQGSPVENGDDPAAVADPSAPLQLLRRKNDSFPAYPEHVRDQLLRHPDLTAVDPIEAQQQPPAELLLETVVTIAQGRLRGLRPHRLGIAQQHPQNRAAELELALQGRGFPAQRSAGALHRRASRRRSAAEHQGEADPTLATDERELGTVAVIQLPDQRHDACSREVEILLR